MKLGKSLKKINIGGKFIGSKIHHVLKTIRQSGPLVLSLVMLSGASLNLIFHTVRLSVCIMGPIMRMQQESMGEST